MNRRRLTILSVWLLLVVACAWQAALRTPVTTDLTLFLPKTNDSARLLAELREGPAARLILIGIEGGPESALAAVSQGLAARLRDTGLFLRVANGTGVLDGDERRRLFSYRYLLSPTVSVERFSPEGLRKALEQRLRELGSPLSAFEKQWLPADPTGEFRSLLQAWAGGSEPPKRHGVWFSPDGGRALLLAETKAPGFDLDAQVETLTALKRAFAAARQEAAPATDTELLLSGAAVFAAASQETIRFETRLLGIAASLLVATILTLTYRSVRIVLISALPLASALLAAIAIVGLLFNSIYGITLAFGVTLIGVTIDYPIHVFSHLNGRETVDQTLWRIWPTLRLGAVTTALGFFAMLNEDFTGLVQLGVFAITGLLTAAAFTRWVLPALLPPTWAPIQVIGGCWMAPLLRPGRSLALALAGAGLIALLTLVIAAPPLWEDDLAALSPIPEHARVLDRELRQALGAPEAGHIAVVTAADAETALQKSEALAGRLRMLVDQGLLSGFDLVARYLPSRQIQRQRQAQLPERERLERDLHHALTGLPFKAGLFEPFLEAVEAARTGPLVRPEDLSGSALGLRVSSLLFPGEDGWMALVPLAGVQDRNTLTRWFEPYDAEGIYYLDLKTEANRLMADFREAAFVRLGWGGGLIVLALAFGLRSPLRVFVVLLPVALAVVATVTALLGLGERLSLFHLVSLLLVLGIGIDYSLFFSRPDLDLTVRQRTLHAVLVCGSSTLAVFGILALSEIPVLRAIGLTVAIGVFASFIMALVLAQQIPDKLGST